jgi:REP element-mobilizing transposase RayT
MARRPRMLIEGGLYHVYNRCARGEPVFDDPQEAINFVELIRAVEERDGLTVYAWALVSNHFHLALRTLVVPLSRTMKHPDGVSRWVNRGARLRGEDVAFAKATTELDEELSRKA